jgi:hypothetical protein
MFTMVTFEVEFDGHDRETFVRLTDRWAEEFGGDVDAAGTMGGVIAEVTGYLYRELSAAELSSVFDRFWAATCSEPVNVTSVRMGAERHR